MKKYFTYLFLSFILSIITGCTNNLNFELNSILKISYNNTTITKEDYKTIIPSFKKIHFSKRNVKDEFNDTLTIATSKKLYQFSFSNQHNLKFQDGMKVYYSKNKKTNKKLQEQLEKLLKKYQSKNFYTINYVTNYKENLSDSIIKIDNVNQYFKLNFNLPITELKIHKVEVQGKKYQDIDLIYQTKKINTKKALFIRLNPQKDYYRYRITFTNKYGLITSIIPAYETEKETGTLTYITEYKLP